MAMRHIPDSPAGSFNINIGFLATASYSQLKLAVAVVFVLLGSSKIAYSGAFNYRFEGN
jgi:hypothetical protein